VDFTDLHTPGVDQTATTHTVPWNLQFAVDDDAIVERLQVQPDGHLCVVGESVGIDDLQFGQRRQQLDNLLTTRST
jgi:hypothetical protein